MSVILFFCAKSFSLKCFHVNRRRHRSPIAMTRRNLDLYVWRCRSHAHPIYRPLYLFKKVAFLLSYFCEKNIIFIWKAAPNVSPNTSQLQRQHYWRALYMHTWRSHWNVQDLCGHASNVVVFFFIIYRLWSSSGTTFHINLLTVLLFYCFCLTFPCEVTPKHGVHATVHACVFMFYHLIDVNWSQKAGHRLAMWPFL